ncbi:uncharacterized protein LOC109609452 isoform X2 [Aethina tumida]|uniref:uncharacterized protein LOC109609452 isoform X2 n=1 Tax=Aethina tumida TaxID=116153 RepID=UPI00214889D6|nr:uncharacterized protein LOC109609452 isoform X2 [Aethina tumida]
MDRVLKRVGLSKRSQSDIKDGSQETTVVQDSIKKRRKRRSKSRRRPSQENRKSRGIFNIDWESVRDCKSCKSRAITRRFCSKRCDNELYRSNSFKFERFIRGNEEVSTLGKKISLCDDYILPIDHLNKIRPVSAAASVTHFVESSPNEEKITVLETYSSPRDQRQPTNNDENDSKCFTSPDREYSQPYTTDACSEPSSDEVFFDRRVTLLNPLDLTSPNSIHECVFPQSETVKSPTKADIKRHPSPYYYGDLYKYKTTEGSPVKSNAYKCKKSLSLDKPQHVTNHVESKPTNQKRKTLKKHKRSSSVDNLPLDRPIRARTSRQNKYTKSSSVDSQSSDNCRNVTKNINSPFILITTKDELDMTRQRHVYETAFDCQISKSDDDLDEIDKISNHPVLIQASESKSTIATKAKEDAISELSQNLQDMHLPVEISKAPDSLSLLPLRCYTPSPPSTAPLPTKFHGKELIMNSIRSAPNLPSHQKTRVKHMHHSANSLRGHSATESNSNLQMQTSSSLRLDFANTNQFITEFKGRPSHSKDNLQLNRDRIYEIKDRPRKDFLMLKKREKSSNIKDKIHRHKYSSTESITSSSCGSMESIKSSTSEGNRSTSSSESRQSSSLSSHSSDSGRNSKYSISQSSNFMPHNNKLHILSPISDKSSQEPISETSDNNRNNNSQKCSPEEVCLTPPDIMKVKRRLPQNRNLLSLGFHTEIQGSDSGISIQSREGIKSRFGFNSEMSGAPSQQDFSDLPFDMPKLRRRRMLLQDPCTSSSATSVDLRDLPFDMPKLRRRLRVQQDSVSQASSSQSVVEADRQGFAPKLTLNLNDMPVCQRPGLGLSLGLGLNFNTTGKISSCEILIDNKRPLEKQGWFHGSITRIEAETVLKDLKEGSFLVRNSESSKNDFSLSLKSAKGFMHMKIQKNNTDGCFILGQFSQPFTSVPEMIKHFSLNRLPIRGAEHMCLLQPVMAQLL